MKIQHRPAGHRWWEPPESDPVDAAYEAHVRETTDRAEREVRRLRGRLARAERRLARARTARERKRVVRDLEAAVLLRREELAGYERLMRRPSGDRQLRLRTGLDDHLELGVPKPPPGTRRKHDPGTGPPGR
jgi:hypothetical protein